MCKDCNPYHYGKDRARLIKLWKRDGGQCYWCERQTYIYSNGKMPPDAATRDHLRDRFNPTRYKRCHNQEIRVVLACYECNQERGFAIERAHVKEQKQQKHLKQQIKYQAFIQRTVPLAPLVLLHKMWIDAFEKRGKSQGCK